MTSSQAEDAQKDRGQYLLAIDKIPPESPDFPAYYVGSTAPNNVEKGVGDVDNPQREIERLAAFLCKQENPEILVVVHGYNTALGYFGSDGSKGDGVRGWYQDIRDHIVKNCDRRSPGLALIGYRWPSEQINGSDDDSFGSKTAAAIASLPTTLKLILSLAVGLVVGGVATFVPERFDTLSIQVITAIIVVLATFAGSLVITLFLLRVVGYFRDSYRASNFGVPDLVELIRQIDKAVVDAKKKNNPEWRAEDDPTFDRVKLSFIGHSMGGFVVTNTVRILSNVFDSASIGNLGSVNKAKKPRPNIGNVFSLGRLVLVSPDIPAETIISGRANFLSSSLRRFEETYLFSNEGDMALKLASSAANYASFPANSREGGYRLGNVVVRSPKSTDGKKPPYGIINLGAEDEEAKDIEGTFLDYLYILGDKSLHERQEKLKPEGRPIAELFTVFDCTDYSEFLPREEGKEAKRIGLLSCVRGKRSLNLLDYFWLTLATARGHIDTHSGYFQPGNPEHKSPNQATNIEAYVSKQLIYGLACLGFKPFLESLSTGVDTHAAQTDAEKNLEALSSLCESRQIQVLLAAERYKQDVLEIETAGDRIGY